MSHDQLPDTRQQLKLFMDRVMAVNPQYTDVFGNSPSGMSGHMGSTSGAANGGADTVHQMRAKVVEFARAYIDPQVPLSEVIAAAQVIEGQLTVCVTLGVLSEAETEVLIGEMHDLVQNR